jgi:hypothetical protein
MNKIWCEYCQECHDESKIQRRRLNTAYYEDELNYMTSCEEVYKEAIEYYRELWSDYYSRIL